MPDALVNLPFSMQVQPGYDLVNTVTHIDFILLLSYYFI